MSLFTHALWSHEERGEASLLPVTAISQSDSRSSNTQSNKLFHFHVRGHTRADTLEDPNETSQEKAVVPSLISKIPARYRNSRIYVVLLQAEMVAQILK